MSDLTSAGAEVRGCLATLLIVAVCSTLSCSREPSASSNDANIDSAISHGIENPDSGNASAAATIVSRGKYLTDAANCVSCHTRAGNPLFAGGVAFNTSAGTLYSSNITPDRETGIGKWSREDLRRAMHEGVGLGGERLYPAFPYISFTKISDKDVDDIYAYLRTIAPVRYTPPANDFLFRQRWGLLFWNDLFFTPGRFQQRQQRSQEWNRGAYLVEGFGHCGACHSPRNLLLAEITTNAYSGGGFEEKVADGKTRRWSGVNLTQSPAGLGAWSLTDIAMYLKTGVSRRAGSFGPMNEVIVNSLRHLTDDDIHAMAIYLKSLPSQQSEFTRPTTEDFKVGASIYKSRCEECHLSSGRGGMFNGPPLAGSAVVQADDPASLINIILYGANSPSEVSLGLWETMKGYQDGLNDNEIAELCNYIRRSWGNQASVITAKNVKQQR
jgi:mono/diheme cytochrome c family protein